jgi:hypothetical protein
VFVSRFVAVSLEHSVVFSAVVSSAHFSVHMEDLSPSTRQLLPSAC